MFVATAQDANQQIYPIAFAVVDSENDASWDWFFKNLKRFVPNNNELLFISDRHSSIKKGIASNYEMAFHGYCNWHLKGNLRKRTRSDRILEMYMDCARKYKRTDCMRILEQISGVCTLMHLISHIMC